MTMLVLILLAAPPAAAKTPPKPPAADAPKAAPKEPPKDAVGSIKGFLPAPAPKHAGETKCAACHTTAGWTEVRFNHDRTGFPLTGNHASASCKGCHVTDFVQPLAKACAACHRDVHAGELGARCDGCHDTSSWRSRFDAEAHRRTNFPLIGGHAALPCVECHLEARERRFSRAAVDCGACHADAFMSTIGKGVDHVKQGFSQTLCRDCHNVFRWTPARYPHKCFPIEAGAHAGVACRDCHTSVPASSAVCDSRTLTCTNCHEHECSTAGAATETDRKHASVVGYRCGSSFCYSCHQPGVAP